MTRKKYLVDNYGIKHHIKEKAKVVYHQKLVIPGGLLSERIIWKIPQSRQYPYGFKYRLILVNPLTREVVLLYDNHWPKGPHIHRNKEERVYEFVTPDKLLKDFIEEEKYYYENKKNIN